MSLASQIAALATRIGQEIKAVYQALAGKEPSITKTSAGFTYWSGTKWLMIPSDFFLSDIPDGSITYAKLAPEMIQRVVTTGTISWNEGSLFTCAMTTSTTFYHYNLRLNQTITLILSGNYTAIFPAYCKRISGTYDGSTVNYIQFHCTNAESGSEEVWFTISKQAA